MKPREVVQVELKKEGQIWKLRGHFRFSHPIKEESDSKTRLSPEQHRHNLRHSIQSSFKCCSSRGTGVAFILTNTEILGDLWGKEE